MDQDSKLILEAYRAASNRGKGHHGEGLTAIEELQIDIQELETRAQEADARGNEREARRFEREAEDLMSELRSMSLMQRNLRREGTYSPVKRAGGKSVMAYVPSKEEQIPDPEDEPIEDTTSEEELHSNAEQGIDELIDKIIDHASTFGDDALKVQRAVGNELIEKIHNNLMGIRNEPRF